jgi:aryl-alcohol dehydrogenase-like predicted oxidoreductase
MEYRNLGRSGLQVSAAGLGCNNFGRRCDQQQTTAVVEKAIELGVTFFDTADIYGPRGLSEEFLGKALASKRRDVIVATKFVGPMGEGPLWGGASRRYIFEAVDASLGRLGTDYIDLYQIHFPDRNTPIQETLRALDDLVRSGKVRYAGCSNFDGWQVVEAQWIARQHNYAPLVSAQNHYNLFERRIDRELVPACNAYGLSVLPYFPLANGFLSGKYRKGESPPEGSRLASPRGEALMTDANFETLEKLEAFAQGRGHTVLELALGWLASQTHVASVISGATSPEQVEQNVKATEWRLTPEEMAEVDSMTRRG